ncbi:DUF3221 domain-containing protein [Ornithinibacillus halophilus]|uniref:DUF3221 domain-containing protein n=1 Tax=Ornithinibacillus halophilus TaxID=930117 RepID=A0A1M5P1K9_9BACI|nr:DUF3221 domain-containing protein [Ornithinibacillus halophilus]SHG95073.1 Protein of unknown function [Ornithinibacillus halophilus]
MMKYLAVFFILMSVLLSGCSNEMYDIRISGYIVEVEKERILVAQALTADEYQEIKNESVKKLKEDGVMLIYLDTSGGNFNVGDEVEAWIDGVDQSYPAHASPSKITKK